MKWPSGIKWGRVKSDESGYILILSLFVMVIATIIGMGLIVVGMNEFTLSNRTKLMDRAYDIAEAGVNRAAVQLKIDPGLSTDNLVTDHLYMVGTPQWPHGDPAGDTEEFEGGHYNVTIWQSERTSPHDETQNPQYKVIRSTGKVESGGMTAQRTIEARIISGAPNIEYDASFDYCIYNGFNEEQGHGTWPPGATPTWVGSFTWDGYTISEGRIPKGAIYTKGNINIPCAVFGDLNIIGNLVATDNITLKSDWGFNNGDNGINVTKGNIVAGLNRDAISTPDRNTAYVTMNLSFGRSTAINVYGDNAPDKGYIVAANDVIVDNEGSATFGAPLQIGAKPGTNVSQGGIMAGDSVSITSNIALTLSGNGIQIGNVISGGKTVIRNTSSTMNINNITAGKATDGTGIQVTADRTTNWLWWWIPSKLTITGGDISAGKIVASSTSAKLDLGDVKAGSDSAGAGLVFTTDNVNNNTIGNISSVGTISIPALVPPATTGLIPHGAITTPSPTVSPPAPDVVSKVLAAADLTAPVNLIEPNWSYFADQAALDDASNGPKTKVCHNCGKVVASTGGSPPQFPATCPYCGADITLDPAGRAHVVKDRKKGESAEETGDWGGPDDDGVIRLKWDITKAYSPSETVYNGNSGYTLEIDRMNWADQNNNRFDGTIVSKGTVTIEAPGSANWFIGTNNALNICSGVDITRHTNGFSLISNEKSHFHFWAKRNIDLTNLHFSAMDVTVLNGSFTAGNEVIYSDKTWLKNTTWKWSRWPIAAQAWVAPVRVLSWKEL